ncbi:ATP-binding protein [Sphaerisporangium sp. NPDC051017]|uniref:ATP-binding protein n=1 Tax=Sphaerisporangium sp. NPDC051017 TaxID=3154636 RepID=UPI003437CAFB
MTSTTWRREFPGDAAQLREVRRFVNGVLLDHPARDDTVSCVVELAANAIRHSRSGQRGTFSVELGLSGQIVRIVVSDAGGSAVPSIQQGTNDELLEGGRGLAMVAALSSRMGVEGDDLGRTVWAELRWDALDKASSSYPSEQPIGVCGWRIWFGEATCRWWAVPSTPLPILIEASSPEDLARGIGMVEGWPGNRCD